MENRNTLLETVLVTGGAGFIGSATIAKLLERGVRVRVVDNLLPQIHGENPEESPTFNRIRAHVDFVRGDVRNRELMRKALEGQQAVLHLAALTGTGQSMYEAEEYSAVNVTATAMLMDLISSGDTSVERIVLSSSRSIYGEGQYRRPSDGAIVHPGPRKKEDMQAGRFDVRDSGTDEELMPVPTHEDAVTSPASVYAATKLAQEQIVRCVADAAGLPAICLRYQNVYGPGQSLKNPYTGILSIFTQALRAGKTVNVFEDGLAARDFVYIDDVVDANLAALTMPAAGSTAINVGTGVETTILDVVAALSGALGTEASYRVTGDFRAGDIRSCFADTARARAHLKLSPATNFAEGAKAFVDWALSTSEEADNAGRYEHSLQEMKARNMLLSTSQ